jgi:hypothetical protein
LEMVILLKQLWVKQQREAMYKILCWTSNNYTCCEHFAPKSKGSPAEVSAFCSN